MNPQHNLQEAIAQLQNSLVKELDYDNEGISSEIRDRKRNEAPLFIKILSILGGFLGTIAFLIFLLVAGLYDSEVGMVVLGLIFIASSLLSNKIFHTLLLDTASISLYVIGFALLTFGLGQWQMNESLICLICIFIAVFSLLFTHNFILVFISVLIVSGGFLSLIIINDVYNFIHLYISLLSLILTGFYLYENKIITGNLKISNLYSPIRIGLIFSFLFGLIVVGFRGLIPLSFNLIWLSSIFTIASVLLVVWNVLRFFNISSTKNRSLLIIGSLVLLLPTGFSPAISGAILLILLNFLVNYKTGLVIGIIAFLYFVSQFYYDLNFTLLTKSIILFISGLFYLLFYFLLHKYFNADEKI